jgi:tripartite-type tricarboxylate transporter receptor subunit TctC
MRRSAVALLICLTFLATAASSPAQESWPSRAVRIVHPLAAGGAHDLAARLLAASLTDSLAQQVIVENRTGAGGNIAAEAVVRAKEAIPSCGPHPRTPCSPRFSTKI